MPNGDKVGRGVLSAIEELFIYVSIKASYFYAFSLLCGAYLLYVYGCDLE